MCAVASAPGGSDIGSWSGRRRSLGNGSCVTYGGAVARAVGREARVAFAQPSILRRHRGRRTHARRFRMNVSRLRGQPSSYHAFMCASILTAFLAATSAEATIIDVGDVFVADGTLVVGGTGDGTRINTGSPDGPYGDLVIANGFSSVALPNFGVATAPVTGTFIMSGRGATLGIGGPGGLGGRTLVGYNGNGTLLLSGGATLTPTGPSVGVLGFGGPPAAAGTPVSPSHGTAVVSGSRTQWTMGTLRVGLSGTGALTISDGGVVIADGNVTPGFVLPSLIGTFSGTRGHRDGHRAPFKAQYCRPSCRGGRKSNPRRLRPRRSGCSTSSMAAWSRALGRPSEITGLLAPRCPRSESQTSTAPDRGGSCAGRSPRDLPAFRSTSAAPAMEH